jgi:catechol 2,3-dioxygenase-like lactoylglutathione lyase family enzyme
MASLQPTRLTRGFNHVATVTPDLDRVVGFYGAVFGSEMIYELAAGDDNRRMAILDLGAGSALNIVEQPAHTIVGDRTTSGSRGPIDHYGLAVESRDSLEAVRERLVAAGATSEKSNNSATAGPCSSGTPTAWNSRSAPPSDPDQRVV